MHSRERFLAALRGDALDRPPVWLMRQAGRYLPGYRALRAEHSFWDVCQNPELSTRAALEPLDRYALDAAIVFSDILVVPLAMGLGVSFGPGEGPRIAQAAAHRRRLRRLAARRRAGAHRLSAARGGASQADAEGSLRHPGIRGRAVHAVRLLRRRRRQRRLPRSAHAHASRSGAGAARARPPSPTWSPICCWRRWMPAPTPCSCSIPGAGCWRPMNIATSRCPPCSASPRS